MIGEISSPLRNMFLNYFGKPSKYLPYCMVVWGGLSVCTGTQRFGLFVATAFNYFLQQALQRGLSFLSLFKYHISRLTCFREHEHVATLAFFVSGFSSASWKRHFSLGPWCVSLPQDCMHRSDPHQSSSYFFRNGTKGMNYLSGQLFSRAGFFLAMLLVP